jgi:hypothetical protein
VCITDACRYDVHLSWAALGIVVIFLLYLLYRAAKRLLRITKGVAAKSHTQDIGIARTLTVSLAIFMLTIPTGLFKDAYSHSHAFGLDRDHGLLLPLVVIGLGAAGFLFAFAVERAIRIYRAR